MTFILSAQRDGHTVVEAFVRYREYLRESRDRFPPRAYALATSDWYFDPTDHRCPHDAWLESACFSELSSGEKRSLSLTIRLLGAYHDGHIAIVYTDVTAYQLDAHDLDGGQRDWRYDELRVNTGGQLEHEVEWWGFEETGRWRITASDIEFSWLPLPLPIA